MTLRKIISGGQTGADRAALDWAIANKVLHGGHCPKGRLAEDGAIPTSYALLETKTDKYPERTKLNVETSNATLVIVGEAKLTRGSKLTVTHAEKKQKPVLTVFATGTEQPTEAQIAEVRAWLEKHDPMVLNVAGSRASTSPNAYAFTKALMDATLGNK
jgi:predicted Rossmann fold nucleotide-binding protein DprA/Smf involved in DNA uptake